MLKVNLVMIFGLIPLAICGIPSYPNYLNKNNYRRLGFQEMPMPNEQPPSDYTYQQPPSGNGEKSNGYLPPPTSYGVPDTTYSSYGSANNYGPSPSSSYESPSSSYGNPPTNTGYDSMQPNPTYGPPTPNYHHQTAPETASYYPGSYVSQYTPPTATMMETNQKGHESIIEKLIKKIDLVLMSKMLLKLIIFKKIIKFIAVICLLMFIPVLKKKFEESSYSGNDDEERHSRNANLLNTYSNVNFRVKEVANFALTAIEAFESHDIRWCVGESEFYCRLQYMLDLIDARYQGNRMLGLWFPSLLTTTTSQPPTTSTTETSVDNKKKISFNDYITESPEKMSSFDHVNVDENLVKK